MVAVAAPLGQESFTKLTASRASSVDYGELKNRLSGILVAKPADNYELVRCDMLWNGRKPDRYPDAIVRAQSVHDVVETVRFARGNGVKLGIRSGGHSWSGSFMRDGGILLDMSAIDGCKIDPEARTAVVGPGLWGSRLNDALEAYGLFFPGGHCESVGLGGYLLQGGFGWNSRDWGPACNSIRSIDVVTADGQLRHADTTRNSDLFWAARGSGPGFFGVVTAFELDVYARPAFFRMSTQTYEIEHVKEILAWAAGLHEVLSPKLELSVIVERGVTSPGVVGVKVVSLAIGYTEEEVRHALDIVTTCPTFEHALANEHNVATTLAEQYTGQDALYPAGGRAIIDQMWTDATGDELWASLEPAIAELPPAPAHLQWIPWGRTKTLKEMAFSMEANLFMTASTGWSSPEDDQTYVEWASNVMRSMEHLATGIKVGDENLAVRPFKFMADDNYKRLEQVRNIHDPHSIFHSYMRLPSDWAEPGM